MSEYVRKYGASKLAALQLCSKKKFHKTENCADYEFQNAQILYSMYRIEILPATIKLPRQTQRKQCNSFVEAKLYTMSYLYTLDTVVDTVYRTVMKLFL